MCPSSPSLSLSALGNSLPSRKGHKQEFQNATFRFVTLAQTAKLCGETQLLSLCRPGFYSTPKIGRKNIRSDLYVKIPRVLKWAVEIHVRFQRVAWPDWQPVCKQVAMAYEARSFYKEDEIHITNEIIHNPGAHPIFSARVCAANPAQTRYVNLRMVGQPWVRGILITIHNPGAHPFHSLSPILRARALPLPR